jgi:crotonobetainyl-CoA:carnitine CoA-transferase CaiB-like acyl-CoA transferase
MVVRGAAEGEPSEASKPAKALAGLRVIDASTFLAGPFCATQLAEFGAEVIKVELPRVGDPTRKFGTLSAAGDSLTWLSESRNKKCVTLDLRTADGAALFKRLVRISDVLVENFQTGTLEGWGLGWEDLHRENRGLVMVRITGYGQTGPYRNRPGFGRVANGFGGLSFLAGYPDRPPVNPGTATVPDYLAGAYGAMGALIALRARDATGEGQVVDIGLYEPVFRILEELAPAFHQSGFVRQRTGASIYLAAPHSHYPTKDDKWVAIACTNDKIFERLATLMGRPDIAGDGKYGTVRQRVAALEELDAFVAEWTWQHTRDDLLRRCEDAQVPCGPILSIEDAFADPQYAARGNILFAQDPRVGEVAIPNTVPRLTETPGSVEWLGPPLGAHNEEIYGGLLGLSETEMNDLSRRGVI